MKPVSIRFKCFGPYLKEQYIDFTQLQNDGLFLICGETGSGKTTILDAMCYALYGKSSGGLRGDLPVMRCKLAEPEDETEVEYIFNVGEKRYRFYRRIKPRNRRKASNDEGGRLSLSKDFNTLCECGVWNGEVFVPFSDSKDKLSFLNDKAQELIGLSYEQFRQVIILPQGQFEKLLVSDSKDKETILATLFHAERWKNIAVKLYEKADSKSRELDNEKLILSDKLRHYSCENVEKLREKAENTVGEAEELGNNLKIVEKELEELRKSKEQLLLEDKEFKELERREKSYKRLLPETEKYKAEEKLLERADEAEKISKQYDIFLDAYRKKEWYDKDLIDEKETELKAEKTLDTVTAAKNLHDKGSAEIEAQREKLILLQSAESLYKSLSEKESLAAESERKFKAQERISSSAEKAYIKAQTDWESSITRQKKARAEYEDVQLQYLAGIGSVLAQKLKEGSPCPVCGSTHHPAPAKIAEGHVSEELLKKYENAKKTADKLEEKEHNLRNESEKSFLDSKSLLSELSRNAALAKSDYEKALSGRIEGVANELQRQGELKKLSSGIESYKKEEEKLQNDLNDAIAAVKEAHKSVEKASKLAEEADAVFSEAKDAWEKTRTEAGFADDREYEASRMEAEAKNKRRTAIIKFRTELSNAEKDFREKSEDLKDRQKPDLKAAQAALKEVEDRKDSLSRSYILKNSSLKEMTKDIKELEKRFAAYEKARNANNETLGFAKKLRGDSGISLQRYVLGVMLSSITAAANNLLKTVYGGRYQLYRSNESSGSAHKRGLELEVGDSSGRRSVTTLSGGEKFLLALSLAIGLSTVVQAQGGGVRLEAMFIDEGFGSLDRNSIDDALDVLQKVRNSSCLVGIISHVERLAETIPAKIEIEKTKEGSQCRISC